jgi:hypothetical protein
MTGVEQSVESSATRFHASRNLNLIDLPFLHCSSNLPGKHFLEGGRARVLKDAFFLQKIVE